MSTRLAFAVIAVVVVVPRLCHSGVLWADDNLPLAAAMEVARGKTLYRDVWFDKPPLVAWTCLLWGARAGWILRLAGAAYVVGACALAWAAARSRWSEREGVTAACLLALFLTFGLPSAVIPLASDLLLVAPHLAALWLAWRERPFWSGVAAGVGLLCSSKAVFVVAACLLWQWRQLPSLAAGFAAPNALTLAWMTLWGSASDYWRQVWQWGSIYAANTFVENPLGEGMLRTGNWAGFHAALAAGAAVALWKERDRRSAAWVALSLAGVTLGWRFFPRYYFLLLAPMAVLAARGWWLLSRRRVSLVLVAALLAVPVIRFAPRYVLLARGAPWADLRLDEDSRSAAVRLRARARPGDTLFVWGFRPEIFVYSGLPAGTRFLESQPLSGVLADRHLFRSDPVAADFLPANRREVLGARPTLVVDGLGALNPRLALAAQDDFAGWLLHYEEIGRTEFSILYRLR